MRSKFLVFLLCLIFPLCSFAADGDEVSEYKSGYWHVTELVLCDDKLAAAEGTACGSGTFDLTSFDGGLGSDYGISIENVDASCSANVTATIHMRRSTTGRNHTLTTTLTNTGTDLLFLGPSIRFLRIILTNLTGCASTGVDVNLHIFRPRY